MGANYGDFNRYYTKTPAKKPSAAAPRKNPLDKGNSPGGWGDAVRRTQVIIPGIIETARREGTRPEINATTIGQFDRGFLDNARTSSPGTGFLPQGPVYNGGGGGGGRGGGGGGGAAPTMSQAQLDWLAKMLAGGKPKDVVAGTLDLPEFQGKFDPTMYNQLTTQLGRAGQQSRGAATASYNDLDKYLTSNYKNAFAGGPPQATAPGMDQQAMARLMSSQGVDPSMNAANAEGAAAGNSAFANIWGLLGANEDTAQRNRLNRVATDRGTTNRAIDAAMLQGNTGIGLQRSQAQSQWQQQADAARNQIAQQEAMANWTRQNQVADTNAGNMNSYRNQQIQALLGLMPSLYGTNLTLPDLAAMGFA